MKSKRFWSGLLVLVLVFGIIGCDNGTTKESGKVLVVKDIPNAVFKNTGLDAQIGLFNVGTTLLQAQSLAGFVAGSYLYAQGVNVVTGVVTYTVSIPLYKLDNTKWDGSGTYDIYVDLDNGSYYKVSSVNFSSGTTTVSFSSATLVTP